jgi:hypothetical protein
MNIFSVIDMSLISSFTSNICRFEVSPKKIRTNQIRTLHGIKPKDGNHLDKRREKLKTCNLNTVFTETEGDIFRRL